MAPDHVPDCLYARHVISADDRNNAMPVVSAAEAIQSLYGADTGNIASFYKAAEVTRALTHLSEYYARGLFQDSARFHRMLDHVTVTLSYVAQSGSRQEYDEFWPAATPYLAWVYYASAGVHFQPTTTAHAVIPSTLPRSTLLMDSLLAIADNLYSHALWRSWSGMRFPVWEYQFTWTSGGITNLAPWISGMAQGLALELFAEAYRRTGDQSWLRRGREVLNSLRVDWDHGGVLLPDTSHGYWWEEFNPVTRVWNGSVQALIGVGYFWQVTGDSVVKRMFDRGLEALKYYTPSYDTGNWTLYSLTQGYNTVSYHNYEIAELDVLYSMSGDPWCKTIADRWRSYTPPPGAG